jgi:TonB family protein
VSSGFRRFLGKLMARRPEDRFRSAAEAAQALRQVGRRRRSWPSLSLPRLPAAALLAAVGIASLGGASLVAFRTRMHRDPEMRATLLANDRMSLDTPVMLSPAQGSGYLAIDPSIDPYKPHLPLKLPPGRHEWALLKVCVSAQGTVTDVKILKPANMPGADAAMQKAVLFWRYRPYLRDGKAVPFCLPVRLEVRGD